MKQVIFEILSNEALTADVYRMVLGGDTSGITKAGQFVEIALPGKFLRRPISVNDWEPGKLTIIYKVVGSGTEQMSALPAGTRLDVLTGLGNGYDMTLSGDRPLLVGGGVGIPPLYGLAKRLRAQGKAVQAVLGFNSAADLFLLEDFRALQIEPVVTTADGSAGLRGLVTDGMAAAGPYSYLYTCGPEAMLRAVWQHCGTSGQFSFEERMGCGFGACMGCSCRTKYGTKRICKDGPVLQKEEILW